MSNEPIIKNDHIDTNNQDDSSNLIVNIKCSKLSERISDIPTLFLRKIHSENQLESNVNYDNLCGPWIYPENPCYSKYIKSLDPNLCVWKHFTEEDITYLRKYQQNKDVICSFFENKLLNENIKIGNNIFTKILWKFFNFARLHLFSETGVSGLLGIVYLTHTFFLSYPWRTAKEVYLFFYKTVLLHVILVCIFAPFYEKKIT